MVGHHESNLFNSNFHGPSRYLTIEVEPVENDLERMFRPAVSTPLERFDVKVVTDGIHEK